MKTLRLLGTIIIVAMLSCGITVSGKTLVNNYIEDMEEEQRTAFFNAQEIELTNSVRAYLNENGFNNSGITVTRVVEADHSRVITVSIHHKKLNSLSEEQIETIFENVVKMGPSDNCEIVCNII